MYTWGRGDLGQLGQSTDKNFTWPALLHTLRNKQIMHVSANIYHSAALTVEGEVYLYGCNDNGQLGCKVNKENLHRLQYEGVESLCDQERVDFSRIGNVFVRLLLRFEFGQ